MQFLHKTVRGNQRRLIRIAIALVSGAMINASLEPVGFWPLGILAIALLLNLVAAASPNQAFCYGWFFGVGMFSTGVGWIYTSITAFGHTPWPIAQLLIAGFVAFIASFLAISLWLFRRFIPASPVTKLLVFPAVWVLVEWFRYWPLSGLPWLYVGGGHLSSPLAGWLPVMGALGTGYWVAFTAAACLLTWEHRSVVLLTALVLPWVMGQGLTKIEWVTPGRDELAVALVQSNTPLDIKWQEGAFEQIVGTLQLMTAEIEGADLVVWSESAVPKPYAEVKDWLDEVGRQVRAKGAVLVSGIRDQRFTEGKWRTYNSVLFLDEVNAFYDKRHLVPFGEFVPLEKWIRGWIPYFDLPNSHSSPGARVQRPIMIGDWSVAVLVCYEIAFANTVYRDAQTADLILAVSNGNWFGKSIEIWQQYEMARLRALENGRPVIQASNDGITFIANHKGEIVAQADPYTETVLRGNVTRVSGRTPFSYWGNLLSVTLCGITVLAFSARELLRSR